MRTFKRSSNNKIAVVMVTVAIVWVISSILGYMAFITEEVVVTIIVTGVVIVIFAIIWGFKVPTDFDYKVEEIAGHMWIQKSEYERQWFDKHTMYIAVKAPRWLDRSGSSAKLYYNKKFLAFLEEIEASDC